MSRCPHCQRTLPDDAAFCIYCAAQLRPAPQSQRQEPATGATIRLNPLEIDMPVQPAQPWAQQQRRHHAHTKPKRHKQVHQRNRAALGPIFMLGILFLLATNTFFPGILVLLGLLGFMRATSRGRQQGAMQQLILFAGMALLFWSGRFFPGILLVIVASQLFSGPRYSWRP